MKKFLFFLSMMILVTVAPITIFGDEEKTASDSKEANPKVALPKLVDLGADKCIPCKKMAPILEELKEEYKGKMEVVFIDVWQNPKAGREYRIRLIPTQIFYDASGKELFRHEGFFSKEDILKKWQEFGIDFGPYEKTEKGEKAVKVENNKKASKNNKVKTQN